MAEIQVARNCSNNYTLCIKSEKNCLTRKRKSNHNEDRVGLKPKLYHFIDNNSI